MSSSNGLERNKTNGQYIPPQKRTVLSDEDLIVLVNSYIQQCRKKSGTADIGAIRAKLGWTIGQWSEFKAKCGNCLNWDFIPRFSVIETEEVVDPNGVKKGLTERGIEPEAVARKIEVSFGQLRRDLYSIGLTREEVNSAVAMQNFGEGRFANAMEMISSGVFKTAVKLQSEQIQIEKRLKEVRESIASYGGFASEERDNWVKEEFNLVKSYASIGKLLSDIQDTWYQGSAQLALLRMRMRDEDGAPNSRQKPTNTQRTNRPRFSPRVVDVESQTQTPNDQGTNPIGTEEATP